MVEISKIQMDEIKTKLWRKVEAGECKTDDIDKAVDDAVGLGAKIGVLTSEVAMKALGIRYWVTDDALHVELTKQV